jgi:para-aminobenzoate synthetase component I
VASLLDPAPPGAWRDPEDVFRSAAARHPHVFWLDAGPDATTGWSWIGWGTPRAEDDVRPARVVGAPEEGVGRFRGGWVGWSGYDAAARRAGAPTSAGDGLTADALWLEVDGMVAFDHAAQRIQAFGPASGLLRADAPSVPAPSPLPRRSARGRHTPARYAELVEECRDAIREGDAYQLCLTTRFSIDGDTDAVGSYLALRHATPAHHGGFIRSGGVALLSASPEKFLEVVGDVVRTNPIKGTRPRGSDAVSDAALATELRSSPKERAENVMIVDLMRNDLARVCVPATVAVDRLLEVESYPAVHQLVSTVSGRLPAGATVGALLDAAFPAGSMTGAPKLSAMTILQRLEGAPRGVFAGCFGWIGAEGGLDLAMIIRSIVVHPGGAYVGAGGGITWGSVPAEEVAEVGIKARAPLAALGAELPPGW